MADEKKPAGSMIPVGERGLAIETLQDAYTFSRYVVASGLAPKGDTAETVLVKLQACKELGIPVMRGLSTLAVVNGRLSLMGEAALALIRSSGVCTYIDVRVEGEGDARAGVVSFWRKDSPGAVEVSFSVAEAKVAHLWGKSGPWSSDPDSMLIWRAVGRAGKRYFSDVTMGMEVVEVARDFSDLGRRGAPVELKAPSEPDPLLAAIEAENVQIFEPEPQEAKPASVQPQGEAISTPPASQVAEELELDLPQEEEPEDLLPLPDADTQSAIDAVSAALLEVAPKKADKLTERFCQWQKVKVWFHSRDVEALKQLYADAKETAAHANRAKK